MSALVGWRIDDDYLFIPWQIVKPHRWAFSFLVADDAVIAHRRISMLPPDLSDDGQTNGSGSFCSLFRVDVIVEQERYPLVPDGGPGPNCTSGYSVPGEI